MLKYHDIIDRILASRLSTEDENFEDNEEQEQYNRDYLKTICNSYIDEQMEQKEHEYLFYENLNIFIGTWNVNGKIPSKKDLDLLSKWISPSAERNRSPDLIIIGLQEIVNLTAINITISDASAVQQSNFWIKTLLQIINNSSFTRNKDDSYTCLANYHLVGILHVIFVRSCYKQKIKHVSCDTVNLGMMGYTGNKGSISIRFQILDSTLCFVCCHLTARKENVLARDNNYWSVLFRSTFHLSEKEDNEEEQDETKAQKITEEEEVTLASVSSSTLDTTTGTSSSSSSSSNSTSIKISDHDVIFWFGDLNYRVQQDDNDVTIKDKVEKLARRKNYQELLLYDQLKREQQNKRALIGFQEGSITFPPTYKYQPGTHSYESRIEMKPQIPCWTDRILWKEQKSTSPSSLRKSTTTPKVVKQLSYTSCPELTLSDHKPISSTFIVKIKNIKQSRYQSAYQRVLKQLNQMNQNDLNLMVQNYQQEEQQRKSLNVSIVIPTTMSYSMEIFLFLCASYFAYSR